MHYWNRNNFEGLAAIADELRGDPQLGPMGRYCELRAEGLRKRALTVARDFVRTAGTWPPEPKVRGSNPLGRAKYSRPYGRPAIELAFL